MFSRRMQKGDRVQVRQLSQDGAIWNDAVVSRAHDRLVEVEYPDGRIEEVLPQNVKGGPGVERVAVDDPHPAGGAPSPRNTMGRPDHIPSAGPLQKR